LRNSFKYASKRDWGQIAKDLKPVYTAASEAEALDRFAEFSGKWEKRYPAIIRLWENAWAEFVPFLGKHSSLKERAGVKRGFDLLFSAGCPVSGHGFLGLLFPCSCCARSGRAGGSRTGPWPGRVANAASLRLSGVRQLVVDHFWVTCCGQRAGMAGLL
jgi:hypothetical protein